MNTKVAGFRRPFAIASSSNGIVCLTESSGNNVFIFFTNNKYISKKISQIKLHSARFVVINEKSEIIILDDISGTLNWFNFKLNIIKSMKLPGSSYGAMTFDKQFNKIYLSILDLSSIFQISSDGISMIDFLDYSNIDGCNNVNGLAVHNNRVILLDTLGATLFDVNYAEDKLKYSKHLKYGRGGKGSLRNPSDVNISSDFIVVYDYHNYFIQFFDHSLQFIYQVGGKGQNLNQFDLPVSGFLVDDEVYVCDKNNDRVILFNSKSKDFDVIVEDEFIEGYLRRPSGIAIDSDNNIFVADRSNGVIQKFDENLNFLEILSIENSSLNRPSSISIVEENNKKYVAIIERKSGKNSALNFYKLTEDEKTLQKSGDFKGVINLNDPQDMVSSGSSFVYISDTLNRRIIQVDRHGNIINQVSMAEITGNRMVMVKTVTVREDGDVFSADFEECIVYQFDAQLKFKNIIDFSKFKNKIQVIRAVYAEKNYLILCVRGNNEVLIFDYDAKLLKEVKPKSQSGIDWNHPVKICKTRSGEMLVADKENDRILKFDNEISLIVRSTGGYRL